MYGTLANLNFTFLFFHQRTTIGTSNARVIRMAWNIEVILTNRTKDGRAWNGWTSSTKPTWRRPSCLWTTLFDLTLWTRRRKRLRTIAGIPYTRTCHNRYALLIYFQTMRSKELETAIYRIVQKVVDLVWTIHRSFLLNYKKNCKNALIDHLCMPYYSNLRSIVSLHWMLAIRITSRARLIIILLLIKWKFELTVHFKHEMIEKIFTETS